MAGLVSLSLALTLVDGKSEALVLGIQVIAPDRNRNCRSLPLLSASISRSIRLKL